MTNNAAPESKEGTAITVGEIKALLRRAAWFQRQGYDLSMIDGRDVTGLLKKRGNALITDVLQPWFWSLPDTKQFFIMDGGKDPQKENFCYLPLSTSASGEEDDDGVPDTIGPGIIAHILIGAMKNEAAAARQVYDSFDRLNGKLVVRGDTPNWVDQLINLVWFDSHLSFSTDEILEAVRTIAERTMDAEVLKTLKEEEVLAGLPEKLASVAADHYVKAIAGRMKVMEVEQIEEYNRLLEKGVLTWAPTETT